MKLLGTIFNRRADWSPIDDRWYRPLEGGPSETGEYITGDSAMRVAVVFACVNFRARSIASAEVEVLRRSMPASGIRLPRREPAPEHPLYRVLHEQPNEWQTPMEFLGMMEAHRCLRGNAYAQIVLTASGFVDQLIPIHPDRCIPRRVPGRNYVLEYHYTDLDGRLRILPREDVLHVREMTLDGMVGVNRIAYAREKIGEMVATDRHRARFFRRDARPSVAIMSKTEMSPDAQANLRTSIYADHAGSNHGGVIILEEDLDIKTIGISGKDMEFLDSIKANAVEICRFMNVHPRKVFAAFGDSQTYTNVEQASIESDIDTIHPESEQWEQRMELDLMTPEDRALHCIEFCYPDTSRRADSKTRAEVDEIDIRSGVICPDEARAARNLNPRGDREGEMYWRSDKIVPAGTPVSATTITGSPVENSSSGQGA